MMKMQRRAKVIRVDIEERDSALLFATSRQLNALFAAGRNFAELNENIRSAIQDIHLAINADVDVLEVEDGLGENLWAIVPKDISQDRE